MILSDLISLLEKKTRELYHGIPVEWRYPPKTPRKPLEEKPSAGWPVLPQDRSGPWKKNARNWFYADITVPKEHNGVSLDGTQGLLYIHGWMPFTLWLDGKELFREEHAWMATGPIADPLPFKFTPGEKHRLILCVEPTELPAKTISVNVEIRSRACLDIAVETGAALAQLRYADALAGTAAEKRIVEKAAQALDVEALKAGNWRKVLGAIARMERLLEPFRTKARAITLHILGHSHIDMDWMWTWPDTVHCIRRDFRSVTSLMDENRDVTFTHSQVPTYDVVRRMDPEIFEKVKERIREGRWENAAGTWVEGDLNMADGESIARHILYAADWTKEHLGNKAKVLWEPDTFGHPGNMPQLARLGEFDCYFHMRGNPGWDNNWPYYLWEGIDGSTIPALSLHYNGSLQPEYVVHQTLMTHKFGYRNGLHIWGIGDHGGALGRIQIAILNRYKDKPVMPLFKFSTAGKLLEAWRQEGAKPPRSKGRTFNLFEGCFTTHASIKKYNRECEGAFLTAEALCALAGLNRNDVLREAWTTHLFNHFHDIFDGAAVHDTYINAHARARKALKIARGVTNEALETLARPSRRGNTVVVFNPLGFARSEPVKVELPKNAAGLIDESGRVVPVQKMGRECVFVAENVPAFSCKSYRIVAKASSDACCGEIKVREVPWPETFEVETSCAKLHIDRNSGVIGSYFDKKLCYGFEPGDEKHGIAHDLVAYGYPKPLSHSAVTRSDLALNVFQMIDEAPNSMAAWHINYTMQEQNLLDKAQVELLETGPVFARFRVTHRFRKSKIAEDIIVYNCLNRVDFVADIDWREIGDDKVGVPELKVGFTAAVNAPRVRLEGPFTVYEVPADGQEQPTQKFADITGDNFGFTVLNDSKYGCDALGSRLRITLLRNGYNPDPESDNGRHVVRFAFAPHGPGITNAELVRAGMSFNRPLIAAVTGRKVGSAAPMLTIEGADSVVCTALRRAEHSNRILVRLFETSGKACKARVALAGGITSAEEVNFLENAIGKVALSGGSAALAFRPFEVKTLSVRCRGLK